ncbi:MAG: DNA integrity scanning diadenylate cyclase DisA [Clostridium sp.]
MKNSELMDILKMMAPGTLLREGLENILRAKTGGLIVLSDSNEILNLADGGFNINADYTPAYIYELAKMDGAIVVSSDLKKILLANTQLLPNSSITTYETGTRHRTAQRVAKQTDSVVIAISQRRNMITLYKGDLKYVIKESSEILAKANQAIHTLEKYTVVFDKSIVNLNVLETNGNVTLTDITTAIQRVELIMRIAKEIEVYICELGNEGRLIEMQLKELVKNLEEEGLYLIKDYCIDEASCNNIYKNLSKLSEEEILDLNNISKLLGYSNCSITETIVYPKGYRILNKIYRLPSSVIENLVNHFKELRYVILATVEELDSVEGIGEIRAKYINEWLNKFKEQYHIQKQI